MKNTFHRLSAVAAAALAGFLLCFTSPRGIADEVNTLTRSEQLSGWQLLFDGSSTEGWRNFQKDDVSDGWVVKEGQLVRASKGAGDIITKEKYKYFELSLEYKISEGGNSGVMFHVSEDGKRPWHSGPEVQIQDNAAGHDPQKAGWLYQLYKPQAPAWTGEKGVLDATLPAGEWNQLFIRIAKNRCEVTMNGQLYYRFKLGDRDWKKKVAQSKFAKFEQFGQLGSGHICLQDHGNLVSFRSIKIRRIGDDGKVQQPITGKLELKRELAFPKLKWEGWEPIDEDGNQRKAMRILELTTAPGSDHLFAATQRGLVYRFENRPDVEDAKLILDIQDKVSQFPSGGANEQGLLGLAFHPKFDENQQVFVCYTRRGNHQSVVARYTMKGDVIDPGSEQVILELAQPYQNHNGGAIEFGPDGYLYIAFGDGGSRNDPKASGQDLGQLLGAILRIDVDKTDGDTPYSIPADNPFVGTQGARPEIFALGLRNPWRIAFDRDTGMLWCGDVGQELWEEVNIIEKGANYGWSTREGSYAFGKRAAVNGVPAPVDPTWEYDHSVGKSITGGRVYRSDRVSELTGKYLYADYVSGAIWALAVDENGNVTTNEQIVADGVPVLAFGEDQTGEVFHLVDSIRGECIYRFDK
ncbi:MAG TPA: glucose dehydrogenase [Planctomycetaceae bacterium]|nr:glucose dehydrogenase [Planctomycetaceae bacterium]